jgi:hypothetical protein
VSDTAILSLNCLAFGKSDLPETVMTASTSEDNPRHHTQKMQKALQEIMPRVRARNPRVERNEKAPPTRDGAKGGRRSSGSATRTQPTRWPASSASSFWQRRAVAARPATLPPRRRAA